MSPPRPWLQGNVPFSILDERAIKPTEPRYVSLELKMQLKDNPLLQGHSLYCTGNFLLTSQALKTSLV